MNVEARRIAPAPIRKTVRGCGPQEKAFRVFTAGMGSWWIKGHSLLSSPQADVLIEPRDGGRWYERGDDGSEQDWGRVLVWEEPHRVVLAWQLNADFDYDPAFETTVEVTFRDEGDETVVEFEHRDLERYGERATEVRGGHGSGLEGGWGELLARFEAAAMTG